MRGKPDQKGSLLLEMDFGACPYRSAFSQKPRSLPQSEVKDSPPTARKQPGRDKALADLEHSRILRLPLLDVASALELLAGLAAVVVERFAASLQLPAAELCHELGPEPELALVAQPYVAEALAAFPDTRVVPSTKNRWAYRSVHELARYFGAYLSWMLSGVPYPAELLAVPSSACILASFPDRYRTLQVAKLDSLFVEDPQFAPSERKLFRRSLTAACTACRPLPAMLTHKNRSSVEREQETSEEILHNQEYLFHKSKATSIENI